MAERSARGVGAVCVALAIFLLMTGGGVFALSCVGRWRVYGMRNAAEEFDLRRTIGFALLAFAMQFVFGLYFGIRDAQSERLRADDRAPRVRTINPPLLWLLLWLVLFNVPWWRELWHVLHVPGMWSAMRAHRVPLWPPMSLYTPVHHDLIDFLWMGNLGLFVGFLGAFGAIRLAQGESPGQAPS